MILDIASLLNKYKENERVASEQLNADNYKLSHAMSCSKEEIDWAKEDIISLTGQLSVYECIIRDLEKLDELL